MNRSAYCGIDFGTSNSAVAVGLGEAVQLVPLEAGRSTIPSAIFFNAEERRVVYGQQALSEYLEGYSGRLMRSLKSILGSDLINETTQVGNENRDFKQIIGLFLQYLKRGAEDFIGSELERVVIGRPVHFVDDDAEADQRAEDELREIARAQGFRDIAFEYEPIAAARDYESTLQTAQTVLVVDVGGGTSDFSVVHLAPEKSNQFDRKADILANAGVHIGGTDFDRQLNLISVMRDMGYKSLLQNGLEVPAHFYTKLSTWHLINFLYTQKSMIKVRQMHQDAQQKEFTARLIKTLERQAGHELASLVEKAKIALASQESIELTLSAIDPNWVARIDQSTLMRAIGDDTARIIALAEDTVIHGAGIGKHAIDAVFMTGGSTGLPGFEESIQRSFPQSTVIHGDRFTSVAKGLGVVARQHYH